MLEKSKRRLGDRIVGMAFDHIDVNAQLTEERVTRTTEYMHKEIPDGIEVCLLKQPLTAKEWDQILRNQEIVAKLPELLGVFMAGIIGMTLDEEDTVDKTINFTIKTWMKKNNLHFRSK